MATKLKQLSKHGAYIVNFSKSSLQSITYNCKIYSLPGFSLATSSGETTAKTSYTQLQNEQKIKIIKMKFGVLKTI